jgi:ubiquinol-cytochrome c reductase cytochrome c1 subunit
MKKFLLTLVVALIPSVALAAGGAKMPLEHIELDRTNEASLQRGMATFVNNCLGCHSAQYQRYERSATDLNIPANLVEEHLIFGDQKIGEQMTIAMKPADSATFFGNPPPDLTLETRLRGPDWVYTYLKSFYKDDSRPWGVNNALFKDVGMPNVLEHLQGTVTNRCSDEELVQRGLKSDIDPLTGVSLPGCLTVDNGTGSLEPAEFDKVIYDLVNYMAYMAEPSKADSHRIGTNVLIFLFFFFFIAYALKKEYWKDIH